MMIKRQVGERGQVVLPKDIRESLGIKAGSEIVFDLRNDEILIKPAVNTKKWLEDFFKTNENIKLKLDAKKIKEITDEQYEEKYGLY